MHVGQDILARERLAELLSLESKDKCPRWMHVGQDILARERLAELLTRREQGQMS